MIAEYTIEQFIEDFEIAQTPDAKQEVLLKLLDSDIDVVDNKEILIEYKAQIRDLYEQINIEEDIKINDLIDKDLMSLYTCTKSVNKFVEGSRYYVQIVDYKSNLVAIEGVDIPDAIKEYVDNIKPLIWIVTDNGIGSLKYKVLVTDFDFSKHFNK
jgi:hypothetical protein